MEETETIRLGQYLKLLGLVATGGEAKYVIQAGRVKVNGQVETRRKRQLYAGDTVELDGRTFTVTLERSLGSPPRQGEPR